MYVGREIQLRQNVPDGNRAQATDTLRGYYAHMSALDDCLGRLFETLDRAGAAEDTLVVFTSDHGDMMLSQGLTTKLYPWDESIRVPLLIVLAVLKALLVVLFYMHLRYDNKWYWFILLMPVGFVLLLGTYLFQH